MSEAQPEKPDKSIQESDEKGIIERIALKPELADFENNPKLKFKLYMLTIEEVFTILQKDLNDGIPETTLLDFKKALNEIAGGFYELYRSSIHDKLTRDKIQPLINKASNKLGPALSFKKQGKEEEYLNLLTDCRDLLFELDEYLITIQLDRS